MTDQTEQNFHAEITPSLPVLMYKAQELFGKGFILDPDVPPSQIGFAYRAHFIKEVAQELVEASEPAELSFDVVQPVEDVVKPITKSVGRLAKVKK